MDRQSSTVPVRMLHGKDTSPRLTRARVCSDEKTTYVDLCCVVFSTFGTRVRPLSHWGSQLWFSRDELASSAPPVARLWASEPAHRLVRHPLGGCGDGLLVFRRSSLRLWYEERTSAHSSLYACCVTCRPLTTERRPLFGNHVIPAHSGQCNSGFPVLYYTLIHKYYTICG